MKISRAFIILSAGIIFCAVSRQNLFAYTGDVLNITTDYRVRGVSYSKTSFDVGASSSIAYYSQRLSVGISADLSPNIEIGTKLTALGVAGSSSTSNTLGPYPYQRTDFVPFIENAYLKITKLAGSPLNIIVGKQSLEYGDGLIISDNGTGLLAFRLSSAFHLWIPGEVEFMQAKVQDGVDTDRDEDLMGLITRLTVKKNLLEIAYFQDDDRSGTIYKRGLNSIGTTEILKKYYDIRYGHQEKILTYQFEYAQQKGFINEANATNIDLDGYSMKAYGKLTGDKTKLGKMSAYAGFALASGNTKTSDLNTSDLTFTPKLTKRFDGLERAGYGQLFAATSYDSFFPVPVDYSGLNTLNVGTDFSPIYGWTFNIDYYLFSASQGPAGAPEASGFEKIFGANFSLGLELDLGVKYTLSKNVSFALAFDRYTPPSFATYWADPTPATFYEMEINTKF